VLSGNLCVDKALHRTIHAYQIFDSRGTPTIETQITLDDNTTGRGTVPSGASTGQFEALELRDKNPKKFRGKSVYQAIHNVNTILAPKLLGQNVLDQSAIDNTLLQLDATKDKSRLGANAILSVSMAAANAAANHRKIPLYQSLTRYQGNLLPLPEIQIIGGGAHATRQLAHLHPGLPPHLHRRTNL
jgi:enolase